MKRTTFIFMFLLSFQVIWKVSAQNPDLLEKETLETQLLSERSFINATGRDTAMIPLDYSRDFTLEVQATVNSAIGRGLDMEARFSDGKGFRSSVTSNLFSWTSSLSNIHNLTYSRNNEEQTFRFAVSNGVVYIYQNGKYINSERISRIKDIGDNNSEVDPTGSYGTEIIGTWAGEPENNSGKPTDYGWDATLEIPWNTAGSNSGVRYLDVDSNSGTKHYLESGNVYEGRLMSIRWDGSSIQSAYYSYPVTLDAYTSYEFSMLYELWSNAGPGATISVGISKTKDGIGIADSKTFVTGNPNILKEGNFAFTSQEAGEYYLMFKGDWAMFAISALSLKEFVIEPRLVFGKNYINGAVDMNISSVTFEREAYAPVDNFPPAPVQDLVITGRKASASICLNSNIIINGHTDFHIEDGVTPLINSRINLNSDDSWLFFDNIHPSEVKANWLDKIRINGISVDEESTRIGIYGAGTLIIPNGNTKNTDALQVFTGENFTGESKYLDIKTYHNALEGLDNKIKSFKLKRGYMATLANNPDGTGYSRVFIADEADIELPVLPDYLDETISFIRVFRWEWTGKKGWCQTGGDAKYAAEKTYSTWYYSWSADQIPTEDVEYVPMRHNPGWPSWEQINEINTSTHLLGFNEPDRSDQAYMTVEEAIEQWPEMMKSGLRIGSPAPSAPGNGNNWLYRFLDECNKRNYRVDYVTVHAYWGGKSPSSWYNDLKNVYERSGKRPLWITEWNNGANWTTEYWPADSLECLQKQYEDLKGILQVLDTAHFVERYSIYNWVEDKRAIIIEDKLTPAGEYYKNNKSGIAFNPANEVIPTWQPYAPALSDTVLPGNERVTITWVGVNDELIIKYILERRLEDETEFSKIAEFTDINQTSFEDDLYDKAQYRMKVLSKFGTESEYSEAIEAIKDSVVSPPTVLKGNIISSSIIDLEWSEVDKARGYNLKRSENQDGPYETIILNENVLLYTDTGLKENTTYYYKVSSVNYAGESVDSEPLILSTKPLLIPSAVSGLRIASGDGKVTLNWDFMYDAVFYIKRSDRFEGPFTKIAEVEGERFEDKSVVNGSVYYYVVSAGNIKGESEESKVLTATPNFGQHAYWNFEESTDTIVTDIWGGYHGTLTSQVEWIPGKYGNAVSFTGSSDSYIQLADGVVSELNDFTITTWANMQNLPVNSRIFDFGSGTGTFMILCPNSGNSTIRYKLTYGGKNDTFEIPYELPIDEWVHLAITQISNLLTIYANGNPIGTHNVQLMPSGMGVTTSNYLIKSQWSSDPYIKASLDDFRIYNYALNDEGIRGVMNNEVNSLENYKVHDNNSSIILYPNPVKDILNITTRDNEGISTVEIYNNTGQKIMQDEIKGRQNCFIDVSKLPVGAYIVKVTTDSRIISKQIFRR